MLRIVSGIIYWAATLSMITASFVWIRLWAAARRGEGKRPDEDILFDSTVFGYVGAGAVGAGAIWLLDGLEVKDIFWLFVVAVGLRSVQFLLDSRGLRPRVVPLSVAALLAGGVLAAAS